MEEQIEAQVQEQQKEKLPERVVKKIEVALDAVTGAARPKTLQEQYVYATQLVRSRMLPQQYDCPEKVIAAMQLATELRLPPLVALRQIAVVNGTPTIWGDLPLALVRSRGQMVHFREWYFDKKGEEITPKNISAQVFGAACEVKRKGSLHKRLETYTLEEARISGLKTEKTSHHSPWIKYTKRMLRYRARSQALKDEFPDALNGVGIGEYDYHATEAREAVVVQGNQVQQTADEARALEAEILGVENGND